MLQHPVVGGSEVARVDVLERQGRNVAYFGVMLCSRPEVGSPFAVRNFGTEQEVSVAISEVRSGRACNCQCGKCGEPLVAKKGPVLRHHFAHHTAGNCVGGLETSIHKAAKQIVKEALCIMMPGEGYLPELRGLPDWDQYVHQLNGRQIWLFPPQLRRFRAVEKERPHAVGPREVQPDITGDADFLIEFRVTHAVDELKKEALRKLGLSCLEIDLRPFIADWLGGEDYDDTDDALEQLKDFLLKVDSDRAWMHEARTAEWLRAHRRQVVTQTLLLPEPTRTYR